MGLAEIYRDLQAAAAAGALQGDAPGGLADVLRSLGRAGGSLPVTNGQATLGSDSAWLTGGTTFLNTSWDLNLTAHDDSDATHPNRALMVLTLTVSGQTTPWTFGAAFGAVLPKSRRVKAGESGGLVLGDSVITPLVLEQPTLVTGNKAGGGFVLPRLAGSVPLDGRPDAPGSNLLAGYAPYLGTPLYTEGTIDFADAAAPELDLLAASLSAQLQLANLTVTAIGIRFTTEYPDPSFLPEQNARRSAALLFARVTLPTVPSTEVDVEGPLLTGDNIWPLEIKFSPVLTLQSAIQALMAMTGAPGADSFALPPGIAPLNEFGLAGLGFGVDPPSGDTPGLPGLSYTSVAIESTRPWDPPIPYLLIDKVGTQWLFTFGVEDGSGGTKTMVTGSVYGTMTFGAKKAASLGSQAPYLVRSGGDGAVDANSVDGNGVQITVRLDLPDLFFVAYNEEPFSLPIKTAFEWFFGPGGPDLKDLVVEDINIWASLTRKEFGGGLTVTGPWQVEAGAVVVKLGQLQLQAFVSQSERSGRIQGTAEIEVPNAKPIELVAAAAYPGTGAWEFDAALNGSLDLFRLVYGLLKTDPPQWVKDVKVELADLAFHVSTKDGTPFTAKGTLSAAIGQNLLGFDMKLVLKAEIERRSVTTPADHALALALRDGLLVELDGAVPTVITGKLSGTFSINRISITAAVSVADAGKTYTFIVAYRGLALSATTAISKEGGDHQVLTLRLSGATLGGMVEYLVNLANPNATFRLDPPWDFLNTINLSAFALVIDPTLSRVALTYDVNLNLGFADIKSVGLRYERSAGTPAVKFVINAKTLGDPAYKDLTWDALTQSPPAVPGKGQSLFNLRYLGVGQHVRPKDLTKYDSIPAVVDALVAAMRPVEDPKKVPINPAKMEFDPSSQWLFGIDATVMDTVSLKMVLHDPDLYGVLVALSGPAARQLDGLKFELLYKKVTNDIGVFHARLQLPDAFRKIQLGAASVTLAVITVDIFTNGNFKVDLGFPQNNDWSVCFAVEAGPYNGRGGIYFGLLNGSTSTKVPAITNGTFSPVIELGIGLSVGVGRTFEKGPFKAGMYLNLVVVFEGAIGWFHPADGTQATDTYYWVRGTAGIVGKLYGSVDFKVISASVDIELRAMATLELAAYKATVVELSFSVRASASVKIVFFRVSFSFSLELKTSFTIGSDSTPPWKLASGQGARSKRAMLARMSEPARDGLALRAAGPDAYRLHFDKDAKVFPDGARRTARLNLVAAYTVADVPVSWDGGAAPPNPDPAWRLVIMLTADNAVPADAVTIADTQRADVSHNLHAAAAADTSFNKLVEGMVRWSLNALGVTDPTGRVTLSQLEELVDQLALPEAETQGITWENLQGFLTNNVGVEIAGTPLAVAEASVVSGTPFPMPPVLQWAATGLPDPDDATRNFWQYRPVDATYEAEALAYFAKLDPRPPDDQPAAASRLRAAADAGEAAESMATFIMRDYFRLLARAGAQAAVDLLSAFPHQVVSTDSLQGIASQFPTITVGYTVTPDDSVEQAAEHLGLSPAELESLNPGIAAALAAAQPGEVLPVNVGVTAQSIALANPGWPVATGATLHLGDLAVQVGAHDTIAGLAGRYGVNADAWVAALADVAALLRAGATMALPNFVYANPTNKSVDEAAAVFYLRLGMVQPEAVPLFDWYAQKIAALNDNAVPADLVVPTGYESTQTATWRTLPGDTIPLVAATLALLQNTVAGSAYEQWRTAVRAANQTPPPGGGVALPADAAATVLPGDTLAALQARLLLDGAALAAYAKPADVLEPLVWVTAPDAVVQAPAATTLVTLAQSFNLALEDLAGRIAADHGVLAPPAKPEDRLVVPDVPAMSLGDLCAALHDGKPMATVNGQVGRFMLAGARLPAPVEVDGVYHATGPMTGLYDLVGQQVAGPPKPAEAPPPGVAAALTFTKAVAADWLSFAGSAVVTTEANADAGRNPGLASSPDPVGLIAFTDPATDAVLTITAADLFVNYPATGLAANFTSPLAALPLFHELGVRYGVSQSIPWQTTDGPMLPAPPPATATPSLWPLGADLMAQAAGGESTSRFLLEQSSTTAPPNTPAAELGSYAWGTLIRFQARRIPGLPGTVEVLGADTADRQRLAALLAYLGTKPANEAARLKLLWELPPTPGMAPGVTSAPLVATGTFIVQANLSTETRRGPGAESDAAGVEPTAGTHFASIVDGERFATLLWQCSVVGGGGYWMQYQAASGEVPDSIFDQDGLTTFSLLIQLASQSTAAQPGWPNRRLRDFNNCAVVGDGVDPGTATLSARPIDPAQLRRQATVDPGQIGFAAALANPGPDPATDEDRLRQLYSLLGYRVVPSVAFDGSDEGRPVPPQTPTGADADGLPAATEADEQVWQLSRVVDISRFARRHLPEIPTAPDPLGDPYAGISGMETGAELWFQDVFGNASGGRADLPVFVGYTDPVIGVSTWPSTTAAYTVEQAGALARVAVAVDLQAVAYQPGAAEGADGAAAKAARDQARLAAVYYQVMHEDMTAAVLTSLQQVAGGAPTTLPVDIAALRRYVLGAHALLGTLSHVRSAVADGAVAPTLDAVHAHYGVEFASLAAANADAPLDAMLAASSLAVPVIAAFRTGDTVAALCQGVSPAPNPVTVLQDVDNVVLPLMPGTELSVPRRTETVPAASPSAAALAAQWKVSLRTLVAANKDTPALLTPGFVFEIDGVKVGVADQPPGSDTTLTLVAQTFAGQGIKLDAFAVVERCGEVEAMFRPGAALAVDGYVVQAGDTLADNAAKLTPAQLAPLNPGTVDLFPPGTPVFLTTVATPVPAGISLGRFAAVQGVDPGALLRHNGGAAVGSAPPVVPGTWRWPADVAGLRVPYGLGRGESLSGVAGRFSPAGPGDAALALARVNGAMPGVVAGGVEIQVGADKVTTPRPLSLDDVCNLFNPPVPLDALVAVIQPRTDVLAEGALLVCPPAVLPSAPVGVPGVTPRDAAAPFHVSAAGLLAANAGTPGILLAGQKVAAWTGTAEVPAPTQTIAPEDTLTAVLDRFRADGVSTGIDQVAAANAGVGFLRPGALSLLPPPTARLRAEVGRLVNGQPQWSFPAPVFPVHVGLELSRRADWVNPDLADSATRDVTNVPAARRADGTQDGAMSLAAFAAEVQGAIPVLRLATGQTMAEQADAAPTDVWAVVFDAAGVAQVEVKPPMTVPGTKGPQPRTFALRPLANSLIARQGVSTQDFDVSTGTLVGGQTRNYQGIDMELWARAVLSDMDLLLSAAYARGAYALNRTALDDIADAKKNMAAAVAAGLDYVLDGQRPPGDVDPKRAAAVEALRQQLLVSLARGYEASAVIQYDTQAATPWATTWARLSGSPKVTFGSQDERLKTASVSNGKVSLANGPSELSLVVTVPDVAAHAALALGLQYNVVELEFDIARQAEGYESSDWLTFLTEIGNGSPAGLKLDLGTPTVPLPLRAYPPMPILVDHRALGPDSLGTVADAVKWHYQFSLQHQSAEQDSIGFEVVFNQAGGARAQAVMEDDLFSTMAQYTTVSTPMLGLLASLVEWEKADANKQAALTAALGTFRDLVKKVAAAWKAHWDGTQGDGGTGAGGAGGGLAVGTGPQLDRYDYVMGLAADSSAAWYDTLTLTRTVHGPGAVGWPAIACLLVDGTRVPLTAEPPGPGGAVYRFPAQSVPAFTLLTFEFTFPAVHVAAYQNASARTWVTRNARLLGDTGPATTPAFVYRTPDVGYAQPVVPFIDVTDAIPIGLWPSHPLAAVFDELFDRDPANRVIAIGARYAYTLVPGDPPVDALLPVFQSTVGPYDAATIGAVTQRVEQWKTDNDPAPQGGAWAFWVDLYSSLDPDLQRPVLQLKALKSPLA